MVVSAAVASAGVAVAAAGRAARSALRRHDEALRLNEPIRWSPGAGRDARCTLAVRCHGDGGRPVVFLHGLGGSRSLWGSAYDGLGREHRMLAFDLLGCGASPHPRTGYTVRDHARAVAQTIAELGHDDEPAIVVGHSFGALVAITMAREHPRLVAGVVAICPPVFRSAADARSFTISAITPVERFLYIPTWWARLICRNVCMKRPWLAELCAKRLRRDLPAELIRQAVMHTWESYSQSITELLSAVVRPEWVGAIGVPVHILLAGRDAMPDRVLLEELGSRYANVRYESVQGAGHLLPLTHVDDCIRAVRGMAAGIARTQSDSVGA